MGEVVAKTRDPVTEIVKGNLRKFRDDAKLTVEQVAAFTKLSLDSLRRWEAKDKSGPPYEALLKLGEIYGHSVDDFRLEKPPPADLRHRPGVALIELPGVNAPPELLEKIQALIDEANQVTRGEKKSRSRR